MILDILQQEINVGDEVISTIGTNKCHVIRIVKFTDKGVHYNMKLNNITGLYSTVTWYMHRASRAAKNMYKI